MNNATDKKDAIKLGFSDRLKNIFTHKENKLGKLYDHLNSNGCEKRLVIKTNGDICEKYYLFRQDNYIFSKQQQMQKIQAFSEKIAAKKIQLAFREHLIKNNRIKSSEFDENTDFIATTYNGNKKDLIGRTYFLNKNHPPVYLPNQPINGIEEGSFKHVIRKDKHFVALASNNKNKNKKFSMENKIDDLKGIKSVKFGLAVNHNLMIARNAGESLLNCIEKKNILPNHFNNAVNDLKKLHNKHTYLRDIKPGNMAYDGKQINFIDVDDRVIITHNPYKNELKHTFLGAKVIYTKKYITKELLSHIYNKNKLATQPAVVKYLKAADEYAFITSMITATTHLTNIVSILNPTEINTKKYNSTGTINSENRNILGSWLNENVKPKYHESIISLLTNPVDYAKKARKTYLSDMLLLSGK
ncbi:hypothetical protein ABF237_002234 [Yersinia ruckeri]